MIDIASIVKTAWQVLLVTTIAAAASFLSAFIVGVLLLSDTFAGNDYFGALLYYFWCSLPILLVAPYFLRKQFTRHSFPVLVLLSVSSGLFLYFLSYLIVHWYEGRIDHWPSRHIFELAVKYSMDPAQLAYLAAIYALNMLLVNWSILKKS